MPRKYFDPQYTDQGVFLGNRLGFQGGPPGVVLNSLGTYLSQTGGYPPPGSDIAIAYGLYPTPPTPAPSLNLNTGFLLQKELELNKKPTNPIMTNLSNSLQTNSVNTSPANSGLLLLGLGVLIVLFAIK